MMRITSWAGVVIACGAALLLCAIAWAQDVPADELAAQGKAHFKAKRYAAAMSAFRSLIDEHGRHDEVASGNAHWYLGRCLTAADRHAAAAAVLSEYRAAYPKGAGTKGIVAELFRAHAAMGDVKAAQADAKLLFKRFPEDRRSTFPVLLQFVRNGWKVPKLSTSYDVLSDWTFDSIDGRKDPDARLAFIELLRQVDPRADLFTDGGYLYCQGWAHMQAGRLEEAITLGEKYLRKYRRGRVRDRAHILLAESLLALPEPDLERARRHLQAILAEKKGRSRTRATELMALAATLETGAQLAPGLPTEAGLGRVVVLTNLKKSHPYRRALADWRERRQADVVTFRGVDVDQASKQLGEHGAEFVAVVVRPETVDMNFHQAMLELSRGLDDDPMPDFHFGYLTARTAADLEAFAAAILAKEELGGSRGRVVNLATQQELLAELDFVLHFGHGMPSRVVDMMTGKEIDGLSLPNHPVVFSGACFNGVLSRSYHRCAMKPVFAAPDEIDPEELVSLGWVHAGAAGLLAALEGDRGEMALAEWEYFRRTAAPLGEVMGHQYRLAFISLPEGYVFPRYVPGTRKRFGHYDVMLRGQISRLLLSDPSSKPLKKPLQPAVQEVSTSLEGDECVVTVKVLRHLTGAHLNYLPTGDKFDSRVTARVELPARLRKSLGRAAAEVLAGGKPVALTRTHVRHETWGGRRYVNVQVESKDRALTRRGTTVTFRFPIAD